MPISRYELAKDPTVRKKSYYQGCCMLTQTKFSFTGDPDTLSIILTPKGIGCDIGTIDDVSDMAYALFDRWLQINPTYAPAERIIFNSVPLDTQKCYRLDLDLDGTLIRNRRS